MTRKELKENYPKCYKFLEESRFGFSILYSKNFLKLDGFFENYGIEFFEGPDKCIIMPHGFRGAWSAAEVGIDDGSIDVGPFETREKLTEQTHLIAFQLLEDVYKYPEKKIEPKKWWQFWKKEV